MYRVPEEYFIRLHHARPRFKNNIEDVLIFVAEEISRIPQSTSEDFAIKVNESLRRFPGNITKTEKTISNWRTEISALFGFILSDNQYSWPGLRAEELAKNQDLIEAFKKFLYTFQYPGAHIKSHEIKKLIENGVRFKPAQYILKMLRVGEELIGKPEYLTKGEVCHCIFNDLRCVRDNEDPKNVWARIHSIRHQRKVKYDMAGDVIRYAGDIVDYMETAGLLKTHDGKKYYINKLEDISVQKFIESTEWFDGYDGLISKRAATLSEIDSKKSDWFYYVNGDLEMEDFSTDILNILPNTTLIEGYEFIERVYEDDKSTTQDIGNAGEAIIFAHECERVKQGNRRDLIHLIQRVPTHLAAGFDIQSVELDETKRYVEVKTTVSGKPLLFKRFHLTPNEWNAARTLGDRYFVYRLMISMGVGRLFVIRDPVRLYKEDKIEMIPSDGAEITFDDKIAGTYEELLIWTG